MNIIRNIFLIICFTLIGAVSAGQDITLEADYPGVVTVGEQFTITWRVNSGSGEFEAPAFTGFYKLMGPQTSYSSSTQYINGKMSQQTSYSYLYYLQAMKEGIYILGPGTVRIKNKEYRSDSIRIEVIPDRSGARSNAGNERSEEAGDNSEIKASGDMFLRVILNRSDVYVGEPISASVKLFTRTDLAGLNDIKYPSFNSFLKEDIQTPDLRSLKRENVNGVIYGTGVIQQFLLFPQVAGEITIDPVEVTALVQQRSSQSDPFFGDFFATYTNVPKVMVSQPVTVRVRPLPPNQPPDFSGVVGKITITPTLNKDTINVNEALNFKLTVSGSGNIKFAGVPALKLSPDIEIYDPKVSDNINYSLSGSSGQKVFEYVLIPRHYGDFFIPSVSYSYFNISTGQYEKLITREIPFVVLKGDGEEESTVYRGVSSSEVKYLGKDIRFINNKPGKAVKADNVLLLKRSFIAMYGFALVIFMVVLVLRREHVRRNADISMVRNRKAARVAKRRLLKAYDCLKSGTVDRFYEEILKSVWGYLSDKLSIAGSDLNRINASEALRLRGIDEETIETLLKIIDKCEFARFAPASDGGELQGIYEGASHFISTIENKIS